MKLADMRPGLIPGLRPANERRRYFVMASLIGWAQAQNQPCESVIVLTLRFPGLEKQRGWEPDVPIESNRLLSLQS